ncbi:MAG: bifunctional folylpolyglutamate synthase/dihydrofolate synthase [Acidobacteria bacterium]|jgi:dihydrofolate synthase/folylpolyglutamate synthase|nr:bifunctional folylpolyglutamate synthase/dihydrofolate synthase [Acidobacteriota bacterium]
MNFQASIEYLSNLGNEVAAMKLGLENIKILLAALGNPENKYKKVQIAGTNGKGSTCVFLEAICVSAGINVGLTTSPHLISITERIKIGGREISEKDFARHATRIRETSEKLVAEKKLETVPTFFEQTTAIALNAFADAKIELAILETGLGGRFDATTAARAEIVAITQIDFDHQKILGNTLREIAQEKAAIIRADTKVVFAKQSEEAEKVVRKACAQVSVALHSADLDAEVIGVGESGKLLVNFSSDITEYENVRLNLLGKHQIENAKVAILLAEILQNDGFNLTKNDIIEGLQTAVHKGRLEFRGNFLFDGAHNIAGARALRKFIDEFINKKIILIFGAMNDKDLREIGKIIFPVCDKIIFTAPDNSRSLTATELLIFLPRNLDKQAVFPTQTVAEALNLAREISNENNLICVTGSLYLVGEAQMKLTDGRKQ